MLMVEAGIETTQSSRYLVRLCTHAASMGRAGGHGHHQPSAAIVQILAEAYRSIGQTLVVVPPAVPITSSDN